MNEEGTKTTSSQQTGPNRLINELSPYLLQHAHNPVDWYPWGEEAFQKARQENKLIFLSIGYSTCHWCHVMERESFEDEQVAALMNQAFVSIKVDREERPDIDSIYMTAAIMMIRSGGWPLNVILTPDKKPVLAMTYIPKTTRFQRTGMMELIPRMRDLWLEDPDKVLKSAEQVSESLRRYTNTTPGETLDEKVLDSAYRTLSSSYDSVNGGFGSAPKFPSPHNLLFLLRYHARIGENHALEMVTQTLEAMRAGGIFDHVGFGFHRYSTDAEWFAPHFEKMLYDQAMLGMAYAEAHQATDNPRLAETAREIFEYVLRDMRDPSGGFYSAEDADSEGKEGKFYLWNTAEIQALVEKDEAEFVIETFNMEENGNFEEGGRGSNILYITKPPSEAGINWEPIRKKLFAAREKRVRPQKDDKVLADWNGLMIAALSKAARTMDEPAYAHAARDAAGFILSEMMDESGRLHHRYRSGQAGLPATHDDYAYLIWGLLELYETTFDTAHLKSAFDLQEVADEFYWDDRGGGYFLTPGDREALLTRPKNSEDSAMPSGNSIAMLNLLRLGRLTARAEFEERAEKLSRAFAGSVNRYPSAYTQLLCAVDFALEPSLEIVIAGERDAPDTQRMLAALRKEYLPNMVVLLREPGEKSSILKYAPYTEPMKGVPGKATAYVCTNYTCRQPTTDPGQMIDFLKDDC